MKSLEVWRKGYKADFSPWRWCSKCKVSPLPCLPWDSVGGVGQGQFCILHKSGIASPVLWRSPGLSSGLVCWDGWRHGWSAWAVALSGVQAGGWCVVIWRAWASSYCTNTALQIWLFFKRKAISFERFFLDIAHKVRYNDTRVKEIVNPLQLTASPLLGGGWTEERNQLINLKGDRQNET